ncbi:hypothetical protein ACP4OV_023518 [Aristida adscensionis]
MAQGPPRLAPAWRSRDRGDGESWRSREWMPRPSAV